MTDTLREQLLGLGFKPAAKPERPDKTDRPGHPPGSGRPDQRGRQSSADGRGHDGAARSPRTGDAASRQAEHDRRAPQRPAAARPPGSGAPPARTPGSRRDGSSRPPAAAGAATPDQRRPARAPQPPRSREDIDLAKAYAIRAQREKDERIAAEKAKQEEARLRREAKLKLAGLLKDQGLNDPAADIARHFDYGGKIKRIHVTADQLKALNSGELGVVQLDGRYLLVSAALLAQAQEIFAPAVALRVVPDAPAGDDPYADPQYQVPDDLVW